MDGILTIIVAIISSGLLSTVITRIFAIRDRRRETDNGVAEASRLLLKNELRKLCIQYIDQEWIYADELEDLITMHGCYHNALRGNGYLDSLMEQVRHLPIKGHRKDDAQ